MTDLWQGRHPSQGRHPRQGRHPSQGTLWNLIVLGLVTAWFLSSVGLSKTALAGDRSQAISFRDQIAPILVKRCLACHGARRPQAGYQLDTFEHLLTPGETGAEPIISGKPSESYLVDLLTSADADSRMPKNRDPLPQEELGVIRRWIRQGAQFDGPDPKKGLASLIPSTPHPPAPQVYRVPLPVTALAWHPDGRELAVGGYQEVTLWDAANGQLRGRIGNLAQRTYRLAYSPQGTFLAVASGDPGKFGELCLVDTSTGEVVRRLARLSGVALAVAFSPTGHQLAGCGADRSIRVFDVETGREMQHIEAHADWVMDLAWGAQGQRLISAGRDKTVKIFNVKTGRCEQTYQGHQNPVFAVGFKPSGKEALSAGAGQRVHIWKVRGDQKHTEVKGHTSGIHCLKVHGEMFFTGAADRTIRAYSVADHQELRVFQGHRDWVYTLSVHGQSKRLASGSFDGEICVWRTSDGRLLTRFVAAPGLHLNGKPK